MPLLQSMKYITTEDCVTFEKMLNGYTRTLGFSPHLRLFIDTPIDICLDRIKRRAR